MNKQHINDYIVVKKLIKDNATVFFHNKDKSDPSYCPDLYKVHEYTTENIKIPNPDKDAYQELLPVPISECSLEDCINLINCHEIPYDIKLSKDKRRYNYDANYDAKLLSVELIRVKTTIEETVEDSISFEDKVENTTLKEVA